MSASLLRRWTAVIICAALVLCPAAGAYASPESTPTIHKATPQSSVAPYDPEEPQKLAPDNLYATAAILIDAKTGKVLFEKDANRRLYPASTTKILTTLIALENGDLDDTVTVTSAVNEVEPTIIGLKKGEEIPLQDLLYAMMLKSGNDAAAATAVHIGDSISGFANLMNEKAQELGCTDSNFVTPHGLPIKNKDNHYSTAADMARIARAAMKNEMFRTIVSTLTYTIAATNKNPVNKLTSTDKFLSDSGDEKFSYPFGIGIKTGYTKASGQSFVGAASKNGIELIAVVLGSTADGKWEDTIKLMDYGFSNFAPLNIAAIYSKNPAQFHILGADTEDPEGAALALEIAPEDADALNGIMLSAADVADVETNFAARYTTIEEAAALQAPVTKGQKMATMTFQYGDMEPIVIDLVASQDVAAKQSPASMQPAALDDIRDGAQEKVDGNWWVYLFLLPAALLVFFIVGLFMEYAKRKRRRSTSRYAYGARTRRF